MLTIQQNFNSKLSTAISTSVLHSNIHQQTSFSLGSSNAT